MGQLIEDIVPMYDVPSYLRGYGKQGRAVRKISADVLISELYHRGYSIEDIFGIYYQLDEMYSHRDDEWLGRATLTVGDAELAGFAQPKINYEQPF